MGQNWFTEGVATAWDFGPSAAAQANRDKESAEAAAEKLKPDIPNAETGKWGGAMDAYRHCVWTCLMTRSMNYEVAATVGSRHEEWGDNSEMDMRNNEMGCWLGEKGNNSCEQECLINLPNLMSERDWFGHWVGGGAQPLGPMPK